jgi:glycosyltransferase involved in cell wall biosynthesis
LLARNAKLITNVDGLEHRRGKYSLLQRLFVYGLQRTATLFSHHIVADSNEVEKYWKKRFMIPQDKITSISYGAEMPVKFDDSVLTEYNLTEKNYFLVVARLVPENNLQMILNSFAGYKGKKKLVVVGSTADNPFAKTISNNRSEQIIFTGGIYQKEKLDSLRKNCFAYIHGHSVGGTNPALLEAMASNCLCICHDNVFNREVAGENQNYFRNHEELIAKLNNLENNPDSGIRFAELTFQRVRNYYSWEKIASQYEALFHSLLPDRKS